MNKARTLIWWSSGAASAVAAWLELRRDPHSIVVRCETNNEDPDNYRFENAVMEFLHKKPVILQSEKFDSVPNVDEIPADWPTTEPVVPTCDFLCHIAAAPDPPQETE